MLVACRRPPPPPSPKRCAAGSRPPSSGPRRVDPWSAAAFAALLDTEAPALETEGARPCPRCGTGSPCSTHPAQAEIGDDGHPAHGPFLPPIPGRRRMFAGGRLTQLAPIPLGASLSGGPPSPDVAIKSGRTGEMAFVTSALRDVRRRCAGGRRGDRTSSTDSEPPGTPAAHHGPARRRRALSRTGTLAGPRSPTRPRAARTASARSPTTGTASTTTPVTPPASRATRTWSSTARCWPCSRWSCRGATRSTRPSSSSPTVWSGPRSCRRGSSRRANATATRPRWAVAAEGRPAVAHRHRRLPLRGPRRAASMIGRVTTVDELEWFVALAETEHMTQAAERLSVGPAHALPRAGAPGTAGGCAAVRPGQPAAAAQPVRRDHAGARPAQPGRAGRRQGSGSARCRDPERGTVARWRSCTRSPWWLAPDLLRGYRATAPP
jgi:hypothetical protein